LKNHVCFHEDARKAYKRILELGFVDLLRKMHPNERIYTFYDYRVKNAIEKGLGWRVDAILASPVLAEKCIRCDVDLKPRIAEKPSDHLPVVAEFLD
ncbi:MAG: exodeoxyribonuclease III, partial [Archaeoglobaceae archaeon]